jgi:hypothetical protein
VKLWAHSMGTDALWARAVHVLTESKWFPFCQFSDSRYVLEQGGWHI